MIRFSKELQEDVTFLTEQPVGSCLLVQKKKKKDTQLRMEWPFAMSQDDHRLYWNDRVGE